MTRKFTHRPWYITFLVLILASTALSLFPTNQVHAQADQRCWTESECIAARKNAFPDMSNDEAKLGHYTEPEAISVCGQTKTVGLTTEKVGFCLPAGQTVTGITFGGQNRFGNIGDFIRFIYRYGILIAGILSVVMIIIAGLQWTTSGGNSATIDSAKNRISGALVGLILAVFSYSILYIVNPQLVNLRLPQIWMIKTQQITGNYCTDYKEGTKTTYYREDKKPIPPANKLKDDYKNKTVFEVDRNATKCGGSYFIEGEQGLTCSGTACGPREVCVRRRQDVVPQCSRGILSGNLSSVGEFFLDPSELIADNDIYIVAMCNNGHTEIVLGSDTEKSADGTEYYIFSENLPTDVCDDDDDVLGFYLAVEINDESGFLDNGKDDFHAIGRTPGTKTCNVNLSKFAYKAINQALTCTRDVSDKRCGCEGVADLSVTDKFQTYKDQIKKLLITKEELSGTVGNICDISVSRDEFPDLTGGNRSGECDE